MKDSKEAGLYTINELSDLIGISKDAIKYRIKKLGVKPYEVIDNFHYYDRAAYVDIYNFRCQIVERTIVEIIHHSQTFHIYESKLNYT